MEPDADIDQPVTPAHDPAVEVAASLLADFAARLLAVALPDDAVPATRFQP